MKTNSVQQIVELYFKEEALDQYFFVSERVTGNKIEIFIDSDEGVSFEICRKVSRTIEAILDETKEYGEAYTLEVSSHGVGSPLLLPRQYKKNIGRDIEVKYNETKIKGVLKAATDEGIVVETEETIKEGKKKKKVLVETNLNYTDIDIARIKISFKK